LGIAPLIVYFCKTLSIFTMPSYPLSFIFMLGFSFLMAAITGIKAVLNDGDRAAFYCSFTYISIFFNCLLVVIDFDLGHYGFLSAGGLESSPALWFNYLTPTFMLFFYRDFLDMKQQSFRYYSLITWGLYVLLACIGLKIMTTFMPFAVRIFEEVSLVFQFVLLGLFIALPLYSLRFWQHEVYRYAAWSSWFIVLMYAFFLFIYFGGIDLPSWQSDNILFGITVVDGILFWIALTVRDSQISKVKALFEKQAITNEIRALRSQMNPHFIFNSLNAIKAYNLTNDTEKVDLYLTKFSRIIRQVLENSASEKITLENELNTLRLYLEMEKLRAGDKLNYEILVSDDIEPALIELPPLLIQPYVENAIWHGLMHKEGGGRVTVSVETGYTAVETRHTLSLRPNTNILQITITDNGIGRKAAALHKKATQTQSFGTKLTAERIKHLGHAHASVAIEDLEEGTRITIILHA
jgi:hypothetical protein